MWYSLMVVYSILLSTYKHVSALNKCFALQYVPTPVLLFVMQSVKTPQMSQNAKLSFWSHFKATSKLFPELFKFCLSDIHIQSYN